MSVCFYSKSAAANVGMGSGERAPDVVTPAMQQLQAEVPNFRQQLSNFYATGKILMTLLVGDFCRHIVGGGSLIGERRLAYNNLLSGLVSEMRKQGAVGDGDSDSDGAAMQLCFLSVEHAFHCAKLACVGQFEKALCFEYHLCAPEAVGRVLSGAAIKAAGGRRGLYTLSPSERDTWAAAMPHVLKYLVVEKFTQNKDLQDMLCLTEGLELRHIANPRKRAGSVEREQRWTWLEAHRDSILQARLRAAPVAPAAPAADDDEEVIVVV